MTKSLLLALGLLTPLWADQVQLVKDYPGLKTGATFTLQADGRYVSDLDRRTWVSAETAANPQLFVAYPPFVPVKDTFYYYINDIGAVTWTISTDSFEDKARVAYGNYFIDGELAAAFKTKIDPLYKANLPPVKK